MTGQNNPPEPAEADALVRRSMRTIIWAGCLAMVYLNCTHGAQHAQFARALGASEIHFGVLGALPPMLLFLQFVAGLRASRMRRRKPLWIGLMVLARTLPLPVALLPWVIPATPPMLRVWSLIALTAGEVALSTYSTPLFFAWLGDLLPHENLNAFWARRRQWLSFSQAGSMLATALFFYLFKAVPITHTFLVVSIVGAIAGVWDILLFIGVPEPPVERSETPRLARLLEPFRDQQFRLFMVNSTTWTFAAMLSAPFMQIYLLKEMGLAVHWVLGLFMFHALGGALFARSIGTMIDSVGHRPLIILCTALKSLITIAMMLIVPGFWLLILIPVFLLDNMLNTGLLVARNGFMLTLSPRENRPMFIAAVLATSGLAGGVAALLGGYLLEHLPSSLGQIGAYNVTAYRAVFALSAVLRLLNMISAGAIREPQSREPREVLIEVIGPAVLRWLRFPVGYFSRHEGRGDA